MSDAAAIVSLKSTLAAIVGQDGKRVLRTDLRNDLADGVARYLVLLCNIVLRVPVEHNLTIDPVITIAHAPGIPDPISQSPLIFRWCFARHRGIVA